MGPSAIFKKPLPYLALLAAHLIWGANYVVAKVTLDEFPPMTLGFLRYLFAFILIAPFLVTLSRKELKVKPEHLPKLFLAGLLIVTLNIAFFYEGLARTATINASVLSLIIPMLSVVGGWWFLREKIYWINLVGIILGLIGAITIIGLPIFFLGNVDPTMMLGNVLLLLANIFSVAGIIISKDTLKSYSPILVTTFVFFVGAITFAIPAGFEYVNNPTWVQNISIFGILGLFYITILSSVVAYFLLLWGLEKTDVIQANLFQYIEPAVAATFAVPLLGERISYSFIVGTCLIILGVYWGTLGKPQHHHMMHKHHRS